MDPFEIDPLPADIFAKPHDWLVMEIEDVCTELERLETALEVPESARWSEDKEWFSSIMDLTTELSHLRGEPRTVVLRDMLRRLPENARFRLRMILDVTVENFRDSNGVRPAHGGTSTTVLVPAPYGARLEMLLVDRLVPVAWLMQLNLWDPSHWHPWDDCASGKSASIPLVPAGCVLRLVPPHTKGSGPGRGKQ